MIKIGQAQVNQAKDDRLILIDLLRFLAIFLMVIFHFAYDLNLLHLVKIQIYKSSFWYLLPRFIVILFSFTMGASLFYSTQRRGISWQKLGWRTIKLASLAMIISIVTFQLFPHNWIFFGVLHFFLIATWVALPFVFCPKVALLLAICIWSLRFGFGVSFDPMSELFAQVTPSDNIPFYPWIAMVFFGIFIASTRALEQWKPKFKAYAFIAWCSRHTLKIYMLHQAVLFGLLWVVAKLLGAIQ